MLVDQRYVSSVLLVIATDNATKSLFDGLFLIPIPGDLIDYLIQEMDRNNISTQYLCDRINGNEAIAYYIENLDDYPYNTWHFIAEKGKLKHIFIKMKVDLAEIEKILTKEVESVNYVTMRSMVLYVSIIKKYGHDKKITSNEYREMTDEAINLLNFYKFYSLEEKHYLELTAKNDAERDALISEFDRKNAETINSIIDFFKLCSDIDNLKTTKRLNSFKRNLDWDGGFILRLISYNFFEIDNVSLDEKQQLLNEIYDLINKYKNKSDNNKTVQFYD